MGGYKGGFFFFGRLGIWERVGSTKINYSRLLPIHDFGN